jgi:hypothetical protein
MGTGLEPAGLWLTKAGLRIGPAQPVGGAVDGVASCRAIAHFLVIGHETKLLQDPLGSQIIREVARFEIGEPIGIMNTTPSSPFSAPASHSAAICSL